MKSIGRSVFLCGGRYCAVEVALVCGVLEALTKAWCSLAGVPAFLRFDPAGAHTSEQMRHFCAQIEMTPLVGPSERHDRQGRVERRIVFFKNNFCCVAHQLTLTSRGDAWIWTVRIAAAQSADLRSAGVSSNKYVSGVTPGFRRVFTDDGRESAQAATLLPGNPRAEQIRFVVQGAFFELGDVSVVKRSWRYKHCNVDRLRPPDIIYSCRVVEANVLGVVQAVRHLAPRNVHWVCHIGGRVGQLVQQKCHILRLILLRCSRGVVRRFPSPILCRSGLFRPQGDRLFDLIVPGIIALAEFPHTALLGCRPF